METTTLKELRALVGGEVIGDENLPISGISSLDHAGEGEITFIAKSAYVGKAAVTRASAIKAAAVSTASASISENPTNEVRFAILTQFTFLHAGYHSPTQDGAHRPSGWQRTWTFGQIRKLISPKRFPKRGEQRLGNAASLYWGQNKERTRTTSEMISSDKESSRVRDQHLQNAAELLPDRQLPGRRGVSGGQPGGLAVQPHQPERPAEQAVGTPERTQPPAADPD